MPRLRRLLLPLLLLGLLAPAAAQARSGYCSSSGDVCYSAAKVKGVVRLQLGTFSFDGPVRVCVVAPARRGRDCKTFRLRSGSRGINAVNAKWSAHFPRRGAGTYRVLFRPTFSKRSFRPAVDFKLGR